MPPEAKEVNPVIPFSPMPGGALTANTQMMRDNNTLHLFPEVIRNMREVVAKGGFGSSVTPVSQFYFQQAFANTVQGPWTKITDSYGKMVLGYFGNTPAEPDPEVVRLASEQLGLQPTKEDVHDINDRNPELGIAYNRSLLEKAGVPVTEENIFIAATCGAKGISFLQGDKPLGIRYKADVEAEMAAKVAKKQGTAEPKNVNQRLNELIVKPQKSCMSNYIVTVDGKSFNVSVADGTGAVKPVAEASPAAVPSSGDGVPVETSLPGTVMAISVEVGDTVAEGDEIAIIEAMKMESPVKSPRAGKVVSIDVAVGDTVATGDVLVYIA
jgi:pyruvate carboxylase subunit B